MYWEISRIAVCVFITFLLAGCSRSGHHPEPIAPEIVRSAYDIRARGLRATNGLPPQTVFSQPQRQLAVGDTVYISTLLENVGTATIPRRNCFFSTYIDGKRIWGGYVDEPFEPRKTNFRGMDTRRSLQPLVLREAKRYELKLVVRLSASLGETNLENNELILYVDVKE